VETQHHKSSKDLGEYLIESRSRLIRSLKGEGILKSALVEEALQNVPREKFIWRDTPESYAYADEPLSLGETGQTISAPHMVVIMLEELELKPGLKVLEIGCGSGYNAALMAYIVSKGIKKTGEMKEPLVISVERDERLVEFARRNIESVPELSGVVKVAVGDGSLGYPQSSKLEMYDRITVTAGAPRIPAYLKYQLKTGGILLVPVGGFAFQTLVKLRKSIGKNGKPEFDEKKLMECMFVPLVGMDAHRS
jgi:protein-L-isoaspartate(D-aspartate) O-methyltransferase